jgi:cell division protein FtsB
MPEVDVTELKLNIRVAIAILFVVLSTAASGLAVYYGLKTEITGLKAQVADLKEQNKELVGQAKTLDRNVQELTVTLKVKGVIQ